jgi:hypothetical protein
VSGTGMLTVSVRNAGLSSPVSGTGHHQQRAYRQ